MSGLIGQWLFGLLVASMILTSRNDKRAFIEMAGLGVVLGIGFTSGILFVWSYFGGFIGILPTGVLALIGYLGGGPIFVSEMRKLRAIRKDQALQGDPRTDQDALSGACQFFVTLLLVFTLLQTLMTPQKLWDERAIYAMKAHVLFEAHSIHCPELSHPDFVQYHPRYPLMLPLAEAQIHILLGNYDDRLSKLVFPMLYAGLALTFAGVLSRNMSTGRVWIGTTIMATVPVLVPYEYGFICGQADAPIACFHGLSVLYLWDALRRHGDASKSPIILSGIFASFAAFTKDEGIAFLIIDSLILAWFTAHSLLAPSSGPIDTHQSVSFMTSMWNKSHRMIIFLTSASVLLIPWFLHRRNLPMTTEMNYFGRFSVTMFVSRLQTLGWSIPHLVNRMFWEWREWGLQWWLMFAAIISRPAIALRSPQLLCILDVVGSLASLLVAGILAPAQLDEHIGGSSHRFLMQIAPVAVLLVISIWFDNGEKEDPNAPLK